MDRNLFVHIGNLAVDITFLGGKVLNFWFVTKPKMVVFYTPEKSKPGPGLDREMGEFCREPLTRIYTPTFVNNQNTLNSWNIYRN